MASPRKVESCRVFLWEQELGIATWEAQGGYARFQYTADFVRSGLEVAPSMMPLDEKRIYFFPELGNKTYFGLPGLLADSLPDRFGNALIDIWLARQNRDKDGFSPIERLCYMGSRGMGALEFKPSRGPRPRKSIPIEVDELTQIASEVLRQREGLAVNLSKEEEKALTTIIRVGTSAGGARAKALIAWDPRSGEVRSGQVPVPPGFEPWLLKFDGLDEDAFGDPEGYGRIEYAYYRMATKAGIEMMPCRLLEEGDRGHFMTRRFDRAESGDKVHVQSLCALMHYDYNVPRQYGYEDAMAAALALNLGHPELQEIYRRMVFNVLARNQDDHTKNIEFIMDRQGLWSLAPAYDMTWSYRDDSPWVGRHQMLINGKSDHFTAADLLEVAHRYGVKKASSILEEVHSALSRWPEFADDAKVPDKLIEKVGMSHRLGLLSS